MYSVLTDEEIVHIMSEYFDITNSQNIIGISLPGLTVMMVFPVAVAIMAFLKLS